MERRWAGRSTLCLWPVFHIVSQLAWSKLRFSSLSAKDLSDLGFIYLPDYHLHASSPSPSCYSNYSSWKITQVADPQGVELLASGDRAHLALALRGRIQPAQSLLHVGSDASDLFSLNNGYGIFVSIGLSPGYSELVFCVGLFFFFPEEVCVQWGRMWSTVSSWYSCLSPPRRTCSLTLVGLHMQNACVKATVPIQKALGRYR